MNEPTVIQTQIKLPNHDEELLELESIIEDYKYNVFKLKKQPYFSETQFVKIYDKLINSLFILADLSLPAFKVNETIKDMCFNEYKEFPELARDMWLEQYKSIHKPYNVLKNRCFTIIDEIIEHYEFVNSKTPPLRDFS